MVSSIGKVLPLVAILGFGPLQLSSYGSGSYLSRPPQPSLVDSERYELGKAVFLGKLQEPKVNPAVQAAQAIRLQELQNNLPAKVRPSAKLPTLAGMVSAVQLSALEYYLKVRFKLTVK